MLPVCPATSHSPSSLSRRRIYLRRFISNRSFLRTHTHTRVCICIALARTEGSLLTSWGARERASERNNLRTSSLTGNYTEREFSNSNSINFSWRSVIFPFFFVCLNFIVKFFAKLRIFISYIYSLLPCCQTASLYNESIYIVEIIAPERAPRERKRGAWISTAGRSENAKVENHVSRRWITPRNFQYRMQRGWGGGNASGTVRTCFSCSTTTRCCCWCWGIKEIWEKILFFSFLNNSAKVEINLFSTRALLLRVQSKSSGNCSACARALIMAVRARCIIYIYNRAPEVGSQQKRCI